MKLKNKKTGEVIDLDIANIKAQFGGISVIPEPVKLGGDEYVYYSLAELNSEWEDYKPKEPLIKDEKIRKAVRAWAEANEIVKAFVAMDKNMNWIVYGDDIDRNRFMIEFFDRVVSENDEANNYTIDELCG